MKRRLVVKIKKISQAETLLWAILILPFLFGFLIELLGLPSVIKYACDIAWLWLLLLLYMRRGTMTREQKLFSWFFVCFLGYSLLGYIVNFQSPLYYLWGVRNNFRLYVLFLAVAVFAKQNSRERFLDFLDKIFWINAAVCVVQFLVLGKRQDYLGGLFGVERGCNGYLNNYFVIVSTRAVLRYLNGEKKLADCILKFSAMLLISALAELKFYFVELAVILTMATLLTRFTWKKVWIIAGGFAGVVLGVQLLVKLFPEFEGFLTLVRILESALSDSGYTGKGDLNRLTAISIISERFLKTLPEQILGMGLGNCDTSGYDFLVTSFYEQFHKINYTYFSHGFLFLEMGYIGLAFFFGFFVLIFFSARRIGREQPWNRTHCQMAMICAVCCAMIGVYNSSLRTEAGYMMYFVLALPFSRVTAAGYRSPGKEPDLSVPTEQTKGICQND